MEAKLAKEWLVNRGYSDYVANWMSENPEKAINLICPRPLNEEEKETFLKFYK